MAVLYLEYAKLHTCNMYYVDIQMHAVNFYMLFSRRVGKLLIKW